ncbi:MAG TPA: hypothetical protein VHA82_03665 [Ramlibacter sp.]|uniref:hypothetical protein n=1 Tax=Ramlibacter sp. TaxID=1917967 RepID=UPI002C8ADD29|nr:hypothetical protein [Ramlibacter sp.]HVZ42886.1 hypothetical protein [Ramlibacter sp.]
MQRHDQERDAFILGSPVGKEIADEGTLRLKVPRSVKIVDADAPRAPVQERFAAAVKSLVTSGGQEPSKDS